MSMDAVAGLRANHADLQAVLAQVTSEQWDQPSACSGWSVRDVLAHVTSNFKEMIAPSPSEPPPPGATAEMAMEALVEPRRSWTPEELLAEYEQYREAAFAALAALQEEPLALAPLPVGDLGTYQMHQLADAYCFDHYCHLRHDLLGPAGPLSLEVPEVDDLRLRPGIGWMWAGLPQMCTEAMRVVDRPLTVTLTGPGGGAWTILPADESGLVSVVEGADPRAAARVTSSAHDFVSWATTRSPWRSMCTVTGDGDYAARVLDAVDII